MAAQSPHLYRPRPRFDVLRIPLLRRVLLWRYGRLVLQIPFLAVALLLIYDGFTGPQSAPRNLATITPYVHYRGLVIVALLLAGNLFCMGCPFTIPRMLAKRLSGRGRRFPRALRNKWVALATLFAFFFLYEWLDLWASPWLTAWTIIVYFAASFALEALFAGSPFCKYVCPLGMFNYVYATASPLQIGARDYDTCLHCVGKECVNGSYREAPTIVIDQIGINGAPDVTHTNGPKGTLGCGTELFVPSIKSNMDCMFCLDCARACPHDNVGLMVRAPGAELVRPDAFPRRWDLAILLICFSFMGLVNAFGMVSPVYDLMRSLADALGLPALGWSDQAIEGVVLFIILGVGMIVLPIGAALAAATFARWLTRTVRRDSLRAALTPFAPAFIPLGIGFWTAHYGFHFLIGVLTIVPAFQEFLLRHGISLPGEPNWTLGGIEDVQLIGLFQMIALLGGFVASLFVAQRIAQRLYKRDSTAGLLPWALLFLLMLAAGMWLFNLPMEMRGTLQFG
ncbi:MAG: FesM [Anaerolineae bacterium]|nr:FesM [Anaerolineae bacterium]